MSKKGSSEVVELETSSIKKYYPSIRFRRPGDVFIQGADGIGGRKIVDEYRQDHPTFTGVVVVQKRAHTKPAIGINRTVYREEAFRIHADGSITKEEKQ